MEARVEAWDGGGGPGRGRVQRHRCCEAAAFQPAPPLPLPFSHAGARARARARPRCRLPHHPGPSWVACPPPYPERERRAPCSLPGHRCPGPCNPLEDAVQSGMETGAARASVPGRVRRPGPRPAKLLGLPELDHEKARDEFRRRFLGLALEAYRRGQVSKAKVRELSTMVGLTGRDFGRLLMWAGLDRSTDEGESVEVLLPGGED